MQMTDQELTRQEDDLSATEFAAEEKSDNHDFGNWPEVFGVVMTIVVFWLMFAFTG